MVHFTPEAAAEFVKDIEADPTEWWTEIEVRAAREKFMAWTMLEDANWVEAWAKALEEM